MDKKKTDSSKNRLLASGATLISEKGYAGVSVREICKHAGTSMNMIHHFFGNKEGLLNAIIESYGENVFAFPLKLLEKEPKSKEDFVSRIELVFETTLDAYIDNREVFMITMREQISPKSLIEYMAAFKSFIEVSKEKGFARKTIDSGMITGFLLDRIINQVQFAPWIEKQFGTDILKNKDYLKRWSEANVDIFINGVSDD